jgi:hypothetical protein
VAGLRIDVDDLRRIHVHRILAGFLAFLVLTGTLLVLPVYAAPGPEPEPVDVTAEEVALGSAAAPAPEADLRQGTTKPVDGVARSAPVLTLRDSRVDEFSMVNVTWAADPAVTDTLIQVRVEDHGDWTGWTEVGTEETEPNADANSGAVLRGGTSPLWTGPSTGVEVELVTRSGAAPTDVQLNLIDPGESDADAALETPEIQDAADAATAMPAVFSRDQWGANPAYMTWAPQIASTIKAATIHHTASGNGYTADEVPAILRGIYYSHAVSNGWGDIGYNVIADKFGRLWEGRAGGLARPVIGAHAGGFNTYTFGVSMLGNYDGPAGGVPTTQPMIAAVSSIIGWKFSLHGVNPYGTAVLTSGGGSSRFPAGQQVSLPAIFAHRDVKATACPGTYGLAKMGEIRSRVSGEFGAASLVNALYADVLGRTPADSELGYWTKRVVDTGDRWVAVRGFSGSEEYRRRFVTEAYVDILGRGPEAAGLDFWAAEIAARRTTLDKLRSQLMLSQEFYLRGGGTDEGFVNLMYERSFGRTAAADERALWAATARREGRAEAVRGIWDSYESSLHRVDRSYRRWLARAATPAEQAYWSATVVTAGDESMREAALVSPEYLARSIGRFP